MRIVVLPVNCCQMPPWAYVWLKSLGLDKLSKSPREIPGSGMVLLLETKSAFIFLSGQWGDALHLPVGCRHTMERTISSKVVPLAPLKGLNEAPRGFCSFRAGDGDTGQSPRSLGRNSLLHCDTVSCCPEWD